ncbi:unnamed protein product [Rhizoctonia solani]|nr:unnamed protein product [Rhizoctonia solani]
MRAMDLPYDMAEVIALNTQYVGIGAGGSVPMLARVSFIDYRGHVVYDKFVLGISHPACDTRDVGLYLPFRSALKTPNQVIGLQTLVWQLMRRKIQANHHNPVENARAAMDLFRSHEADWQKTVTTGQWPCALPPTSYSRCYI